MLPPYTRWTLNTRPLLTLFACVSSLCVAQTPQTDRIQVAPPLLQVQSPSKDASPEDLEKQGDELRGRKESLDAVDYYRAAIAKRPGAPVLNKLGIAELMLERYHDAGRDFEHAVKMDRKFAEPYNNLGVVDYKRKKYGSAIKLYKKAIALVPDSASFYSNIGAAYFAKKEFEQASQAYAEAIRLDPEVFSFHRNSARTTGVHVRRPNHALPAANPSTPQAARPVWACSLPPSTAPFISKTGAA